MPAAATLFEGLPDPALAEVAWVCYAWPVNHGSSGERTFVVDQTGIVRATNDPHYSGENGPEPGAAYLDGGIESIGGRPAAGRATQDGNVWTEVGGSGEGWVGEPAVGD